MLLAFRLVPVALIGVSHQDVTLPELEALSRRAEGIAPAILRTCSPDVIGAVLLSTCNRVELYVEGPDGRRAADAARGFLSEHLADDMPQHGLPEAVLDADAARHLFSVASGLESMVVGEDEIAGQVRRAVASARTERTVSPALERLFQGAASTARQVTATTGLGAAGRSLVTVGLDLVEESEGPLAGRRALVIGTGSYARVVHAALERRGVEDRMVFSLSGRARRFADNHGGEAIGQAALLDALSRVDIIVTASGAPHPVLEADTLAAATADRPSPLPIIDLALTRDVEEEAYHLSGVRVIDLDLISQHAPQEHGQALAAARSTVLTAVEDFSAREAERTADAVVVALRSMAAIAADAEIERVRRRSGDEMAEQVHASVRRVLREILHVPTSRSRELTREGRLDEVEHAVQVLLGLDVRSARQDTDPSTSA